MVRRRDIRRLAMQLLYQIDQYGSVDDALDPVSVDACLDEAEGIVVPKSKEQLDELKHYAIALARASWESHDLPDKLAAKLAPQWPTHRQPPVDRAILRLSYHEMVSGHAHPTVVINEAIELAKEFSSEQSPAFINGVLDAMAAKLRENGELPEVPAEGEGDPRSKKASPEKWLDDALDA